MTGRENSPDSRSRWDPDAHPDEPRKPEGSANDAPPPDSRNKARQARSVELNAIVGAGTAFHGTLSFSGKVRIDGQLEGSATGGDLLVIGEGARVSGELRARRVVVLGGTVDADITALESIELYIPAVVSGDLKSPQIYMDRGIQFHGTCDMTSDPPRVESTAGVRGEDS